jgi:hypothetical protein
MFEYFKMGFGLVTKRDPTTENCNLFLAQYHILKHLKSGLTDEDRDFFIANMETKINARGLYNRRNIESAPTRSMSQDEILGFLISSKLLNTPNGEKIWNHLKTHFGTYNNTGRLSEYVPYNPANYYSWGQIMNSKLSYLFLPLYVCNLMIAMHKDANETSSKIMDAMEFMVMPKTWINKILFKMFEKQMIKQYGPNYFSIMLHIYHNAESVDFPIFKEL